MSLQSENAGRERAGKRVFPQLLAVKQELSEHGNAIKKKEPAVSDASEGPTCWTIFIDELAMTKRPDTSPSSLDREIFAKKLPKSITTEEELKMWLRADFGPIEHVLVLRDDLLSTPDSVAYIRFEEHEAAELFLDAQGGEGTLASWSEAERASRRTKSVYGSDVHKAFLGEEGDGLRRIMQESGAVQLWLQSEVQKPIGENVPASAMEGPYAPQLHFSITCTAEQLKKVKLALTEVLEDYHERTERLLRCYGGGVKQKTIQEFDETIGDYVDVKVPSSSVESKNEDAPVPSVGKNLIWDSATGKYLEEDLPEEIQDLICVTGPATAQELEKVKQMVKVKQEFGNSQDESPSAPETPHNGYWQASKRPHYSAEWGDPWHEAKRPRTNGEVGANGFKVLFSGSRSDVQQQWQGQRWQDQQWQSQEWQDWQWQQQDWQQQQQHCKGKGSQFGNDQWQQRKGSQFGKDESQQNNGHWYSEKAWSTQTSAPAQGMSGNASGSQTQGWGQQSQWQHRSEQSQWSAQPTNQCINNQHHPAYHAEPSSHAAGHQPTQAQWQQQQQAQIQQQRHQEEMQKVQQQEALLQQQQENERLQQERHRQQLLQQQLQQQQQEVMQQQQQENQRLQQERQQQQLLQQQMQQQLQQQHMQQQQIQQQQMQQQMQQQQMQQQMQQQQMQQQSVFALQQQQQQQQLEWQQLEMQRLQLQNMLGYSQQMLG